MAPEEESLEERLKKLEEELRQLKKEEASRPRQHMHRVNFEFTKEAYDYLQSEAVKTHGSMASVIRDALSKKQWLDKAIEDGKLLVEEKGDVRRVVKV